MCNGVVIWSLALFYIIYVLINANLAAIFKPLVLFWDFGYDILWEISASYDTKIIRTLISSG